MMQNIKQLDAYFTLMTVQLSRFFNDFKFFYDIYVVIY